MGLVRPLALVVALTGALFAWPGSALATISVNTTSDVATDPSECSGAAGDCSVRRAIHKAAVGETIVVPAGLYTLSLGELGIDKALSIEGAGARTTTVSGNDSSRAFSVNSAGAGVSISGLTISAGHLVGSSGFLSGGAVLNDVGSVLTLDRVAVIATTLEMTGMSGANRGAGVNNRGTLAITNTTISGNVQRAQQSGTGNQGAGLFNSGGSATITNSTITGNAQQATGGATSSGAGIATVGGGTVTLRSVTVSGNSGSENVASGSGTVNARSSIVADCSDPLTSQGHNLDSTDTCNFHSAGDLINSDPLLGQLSNNGGATDTLALASNSPALNAADPGDCAGTDQRGVARPQRGACDIGAFELEAAVAVIGDPVAPVIGSAGVTKLWRVDPSGRPEVRATRTRRKRPPKGGTFRYTLSEGGRVVFTIERKLKGRRVGRRCRRPTRRNRRGRRCTRYRRFGSFAQQGVAGRNRKRFSGKIGARRLRPARYRATLVAKDAAGNASKRKRLSFRIVR